MQRGQKPKGQVKIKWSSEFAYAIGLLVSDGCLSKDGLHITFSSKEKRQIFNFKKCLGLKSKIGKNFSGAGNLSYRVQFGDVLFSLINYARFININPEDALERTNKKFIKRFKYLEEKTIKMGKSLHDMTLAEMDVYWNEAKLAD